MASFEKPSLLNRVFTIISEKDFENKFAPVNRKISRLHEKIGKKRKKFGLFNVHHFKKEQLYQDLVQIKSITEKIGDDINNWEERGQLTYPEKQIYMFYRGKVELELENLVIKIEDRAPTFWEDFENALRGLRKKVSEIMDFLPEFMSLSFPHLLFGKSFNAVRKLLPKV